MSVCENLQTLEYSFILLAVTVTSSEFPEIAPRNYKKSALLSVHVISFAW